DVEPARLDQQARQVVDKFLIHVTSAITLFNGRSLVVCQHRIRTTARNLISRPTGHAFGLIVHITRYTSDAYRVRINSLLDEAVVQLHSVAGRSHAPATLIIGSEVADFARLIALSLFSGQRVVQRALPA